MAEIPKVKLEMARVAAIINPFQVVINKGAADGIRPGQSYLFYALGSEIKDPETNENLGHLEILRGQGKVIHLQDRMSIVRSSSQKAHYDSATRGFGLLGMTQTPSYYEDLPFDQIEVGDFGRPI